MMASDVPRLSGSDQEGLDLASDDAITDWIVALDDPARRESAARKIVNRYMNELLALIRSKLHRRLQGVIDHDDVAQSVWGSFFGRQFELNDRNALFGLLAEIAVNKSRSAARHHNAAKRDRRREEAWLLESGDEANATVNPKPLESLKRTYRPSLAVDSDISAESFFERGPLELMALGATAEHALFCVEFFGDLPADLQSVFGLVVEGFSNQEIAKKLNCDSQSVRRQIERLRRRICTDTKNANSSTL